MFAMEKDKVLLCRRRIPTIVSGADTIVTSKSAVQRANNNGFFTRVVDCEQSEMSKVELPQTPLNTTMPYRIINANSDKELRSSPFTSSKMSSLFVMEDKFNGNDVVELVLVIIEILRDVFLIDASLNSHCFSSIFLWCTLKRERSTSPAMKIKLRCYSSKIMLG